MKGRFMQWLSRWFRLEGPDESVENHNALTSSRRSRDAYQQQLDRAEGQLREQRRPHIVAETHSHQ